jgi:hypothetical protein
MSNILGNLFGGGGGNILGNLLGGGNNPAMGMLMKMVQGGNMNPQELMKQFGGDPNFEMAQKMMGGKTPQEQQNVVMNIAKEKGIDINQLKGMAKQFGIKF